MDCIIVDKLDYTEMGEDGTNKTIDTKKMTNDSI